MFYLIYIQPNLYLTSFIFNLIYILFSSEFQLTISQWVVSLLGHRFDPGRKESMDTWNE